MTVSIAKKVTSDSLLSKALFKKKTLNRIRDRSEIIVIKLFCSLVMISLYQFSLFVSTKKTALDNQGCLRIINYSSEIAPTGH